MQADSRDLVSRKKLESVVVPVPWKTRSTNKVRIGTRAYHESVKPHKVYTDRLTCPSPERQPMDLR